MNLKYDIKCDTKIKHKGNDNQGIHFHAVNYHKFVVVEILSRNIIMLRIFLQLLFAQKSIGNLFINLSEKRKYDQN